MTTASAPPRGFFGPDFRGRLLGGRYQVGDKLAGGGTGSVHAAEDLHLRRRVAVKVIHPEHTRSEEQRRRIRQEAVLGARLDHPHVMPVFDLGEDEGAGVGVGAGGERLMYLVMPLTPGQSLRGVVLEGAVAWRRALGLGVQLLAGLAAVHRAGALHRDVKPENCLVRAVDGREHLRLLDLGLAKAIAPGLVSCPPVSIQGAVIGTLPYLSPEQVQGLALDERSDLYAVGVVLFEMLTRRPPFVGSHFEVLNAHVRDEVPAIRAVAPAVEVPAGIERVIRRALAKAPAERFASAEAFAAALVDAGRIAEGEGAEGVVAGPPCPPTHAGCDAALASLAAWTRFEYGLAQAEAVRAARLSLGWSPLRLIMSCVPEE